MNKNVIDAMNSINSIDRLQDEAYLDVHNAIMESQNKYEIIKEHGTAEYAQNEFYQESVLAGVLISLGVIGLIVSTILIIKKVNETSGKGSGKGTATPDKPAADMNLFESKSIEDKKKEFNAKVDEILKKIGNTDEATRDKIFEIAKCNQKLNGEAVNSVADAMDRVADQLDNFANKDPNDDSYVKEAESIIEEIEKLNKTIESNLESLLINIPEGESISTAIDNSFTIAATISDKLKRYDDKLSKVEPKLKALSEKAKKESKGNGSGTEGSDANNQNADGDLEALQKRANSVLQPMGKDNHKFFETMRDYFNTIMINVNKADYSPLTQKSQPTQSQGISDAIQKWADKCKSEFGIEDAETIDKLAESAGKIFEDIKNNDARTIEGFKDLYARPEMTDKREKIVDEFLQLGGIDPKSIKSNANSQGISDEKVTRTHADTPENATARKIINNTGDPEWDNYRGNVHVYHHGIYDLTFSDDELKEQLGKPDGIKNLISGRVVNELSKSKNKGAKLNDLDIEMLIDYLVEVGAEMGYKPNRPSVEEIKPILQKFMKSEASPVQQTVTPKQQAENTETSPVQQTSTPVDSSTDTSSTPPITVTNNQTPETKNPKLDTIAKKYNIDYNDINTVYDLFKSGDNRVSKLTKGDDGAALAAREIATLVAKEKLNEQPVSVNTQQAATPAPTKEPEKKGIISKIKSIFKKESYEEYILPSGEMTMVLVEYEVTEYEDGTTEQRRIRIINE